MKVFKIISLTFGKSHSIQVSCNSSHLKLISFFNAFTNSEIKSIRKRVYYNPNIIDSLGKYSLFKGIVSKDNKSYFISIPNPKFKIHDIFLSKGYSVVSSNYKKRGL